MCVQVMHASTVFILHFTVYFYIILSYYSTVLSHRSNNGLCTIILLLHTGFDKYKGGLDTVHDLTGLYSVYAHWRNIEIMFHVSTLLPYEKHDPQKVRKSDIPI